MAQQTAVEWFFLWFIDNPQATHKEYLEAFDKAKSMEMEQHGNTWDEAIYAHEKRGHVIARSLVDFDDYYNETYNR